MAARRRTARRSADPLHPFSSVYKPASLPPLNAPSCTTVSSHPQVAVGVGALAGSTIMLLTLPWMLSLVAGRVTVVRGTPDYKKKLQRTTIRKK